MFSRTGELRLNDWRKVYRRGLLSLMKWPLVALAIIAALDAILISREFANTRAPGKTSSTVSGAFTSFDNRSSHSRRYRAEVVSVSSLAPSKNQRWTLRVTQRNRRRVADAHIIAVAWMPETGTRSQVRPRVSYIGGGRYLIDSLYFGRTGWWNVALVVDGVGGVDSVAFNVVLR